MPWYIYLAVALGCPVISAIAGAGMYGAVWLYRYENGHQEEKFSWWLCFVNGLVSVVPGTIGSGVAYLLTESIGFVILAAMICGYFCRLGVQITIQILPEIIKGLRTVLPKLLDSVLRALAKKYLGDYPNDKK